MTEQVMQLLAVFLGGVVLGIITMLIANKVRSGTASPAKLKQEMTDYQSQVETHFEETSKKFKDLAVQYQDLYKHLSVGATSLCRPEHVAPLLTAEKSPLNESALPSKKEMNTDVDASNKVTKVDAKPEDIQIPNKAAVDKANNDSLAESKPTTTDIKPKKQAATA